MSSYSATTVYVMEQIGSYQASNTVFLVISSLFLLENEDVDAAQRPKLPKSNLQVEIAATVDWSEPFVKAC